ncbi:hypothetical protein N9L14_00645 [Alphaproteobacteria bacterium]|nr:hypothetical protein [Alphaproteobacteria bacterium]
MLMPIGLGVASWRGGGAAVRSYRAESRLSTRLSPPVTPERRGWQYFGYV